jgi:hypothetical protein
MMLDVPQNLEAILPPDDVSELDVGLDGLAETDGSDHAPAPGQADDGGGGGGNDGSGTDHHLSQARHEGKFDLRNGWAVLAGAILIPLGVVFILMAWYGAAHARVVQQQIPYMVSGSFAGLGCMVLGGFLFFGHWLYRMYDQADLQHEEQMKALQAIAAAIGGAGSASAFTVSDGAVAGPRGDATRSAAAGALYATATGTAYHRADCAVIAHHAEDLRVLGVGDTAGLSPCQICQPGD